MTHPAAIICINLFVVGGVFAVFCVSCNNQVKIINLSQFFRNFKGFYKPIENYKRGILSEQNCKKFNMYYIINL